MTGTAGRIEKVRVLVSVPAVFDALIVAVLLPGVVGVPLITPLVPLMLPVEAVVSLPTETVVLPV